MRLSIIQGDPGYKSQFVCSGYRVQIDGQVLNDCVIADEERGFVVRQVGIYNPLLRKTFFKRLPMQYGKVEIIKLK